LYKRRCCQFLTNILLPSLNLRIYSYLIQVGNIFLYRCRKNVKILSLIRNPYERNISHFFQDLPLWLSDYIVSNNIQSRQENRDLIKECFEEHFNFDYSRYWFKAEIERFSGIKLEDCKFDYDKGLARGQKGKYQILIIRMDRLSKAQSELSEFVGAETNIGKRNVGDEKWYGSLYADFKNSYVPSDEVIKKSFDVDWVRAFYNVKEIETMKYNAKHPKTMCK